MSNVIGTSAHYHDAACCLLRDGKLVSAAQEERFSREKHDGGLPRRAFRYCLEESGLFIPVAAQCLYAGVNRVAIRWPPAANQEQEERARWAADVAEGFLPFFLPVLGEIASFTAAVSGERDLTGGSPESAIASR